MPPAPATATANTSYAATSNELHPKVLTCDAPQDDAEIEAQVSRAMIRR